MKIANLTYLTILIAINLFAADVDINEELYQAAKNGNYQEVERLLQDPGANPNKIYAIDTPLEIATQKAHPDVVQLLLKHGADPQQISPESIEYMTMDPTNSLTNIKKTLQLLIDAKLDINSKDLLFGSTPLTSIGSNITISNKVAFPIIKMLLDAGARKNIVNDIGETAVERAQSVSESHETAPKDAAKLKSRALFIETYPGNTLEDIIILNMALRYYSDDKEISDQAKEEIEQLPWQIKDKIDPYLHDSEFIHQLHQ
jgi:ankyrin repeat protein